MAILQQKLKSKRNSKYYNTNTSFANILKGNTVELDQNNVSNNNNNNNNNVMIELRNMLANINSQLATLQQQLNVQTSRIDTIFSMINS